MNEVENQQNQNVALELATLSLKGKRFHEAENAFTQMLASYQTSEAWCGLGFSKLGLVMEKTTIEEVFYCFDKAVAISPENAADVENVLLQAAIDVISNLYTLYINTILATRKAVRRQGIAMISTVVGTFFTIDALSKRSTLGTIASAGFTGLSYDSYLKNGATAEELNLLSKRILQIIDEFKSSTSAFIKHETINLQKFNELTVACENNATEELKTEEQKKAERIDAAKPLTGMERQKYIERKNRELLDEAHPFHFQKSEALFLFNDKKYNKALPIINYALSLYSEDGDLKEAKEKSLKAANMKDAMIFAIPWFICVLGASKGFKEEVGQSLLIWNLVFLGVIAYRNKKRSTNSTPA